MVLIFLLFTKQMSLGCWKPGGPLLLVLPNVTALLLLAGTFLMLNWPPVSIRPSSAIKLHRGAVVQPERLEKSRNCSRPCLDGGKAKECYFNFVLEPSLTVGRGCSKCLHNETDCSQQGCIHADGVRRTMLSVNRQLPGTGIRVCEGDVVVVDVESHLPGLEMSLHWHGQLQKGSQYMDGVPMITQCPILSDTPFRYKFRASNPGTHFYHSHYVSHHADGIFGPFIVRQSPKRDQNSDLYDFDLDEHVMTISPWSHTVLAYNLNSQENLQISSILINGKGTYNDPDSDFKIQDVENKFSVRWGNRYRFRIINAASLDCPVQLQVEKHRLVIIASDGSPVKGIGTSNLVLFPGERYDVVLTADQAISSYWIRVRGHNKCANLHEDALLVYDGADVWDEFGSASYSALKTLSSAMERSCPDVSSSNCGQHKLKAPLSASNRRSSPELQKSQAGMKLFMPFDVYSYDDFDDKDVNFDFTIEEEPYYPSYLYNNKGPVRLPQLKKLTFAYPPSPLLSQLENVPRKMFCEERCKEHKTFCECLHVVRVPLNVTLDIILVDEGHGSNQSHTFHLHGYSFLVLGSKSLGRPVSVSEIKSMDAHNKLSRNLMNPPRKDTIVVPNKGYSIIRFTTDNPGYWLFEARSTSPVFGEAMEFVIQVGDQSHLLPTPANFPRCGILKGPNFIF
ncbi:uncharacterized protein [Periplaneta americana]|uniref:uncharacterized protein isoform X1 n=2 Tax=Periplaneta americana TaxID=6978 RepID=UPI0037E8B235